MWSGTESVYSGRLRGVSRRSIGVVLMLLHRAGFHILIYSKVLLARESS